MVDYWFEKVPVVFLGPMTRARLVSTVVFFSFIGGALLVRKWVSSKWGRCTSTQSLRGKTAIVTGASSGLGKKTAELLALRGARVVLACRNLRLARAIIAQLRKANPLAGEMIAMELDLESFDSIRNFARLAETAFDKVDILVNNAGVYYPPESYEISKEGFEIHFAINHLGHFLLTKLLINLLKKGSPSRVVVVSSTLHQTGVIDFGDINLRKQFEAIRMGDKTSIEWAAGHNPGYCNSKLMNVYFVRELAHKLRKTGVDVYGVCPGLCYTNLFRHYWKPHHYVFYLPFLLYYMRTPEQGAQTILHCATSDSLKGVSGKFFRNCEEFRSRMVFSKQTQTKLWDVSEAFVGEKIRM